MRAVEMFDRLPVEDWAAAVARFGRRLRRRAVRRPETIVLIAVFGIAGYMILTNALLNQSESHPAPFWGAETERLAEVAVREPEGIPSDLVAQIQAALLDGVAPTGVLDDRTADEIRRFEAARGLPVTGRPSLALVATLQANETTSIPSPSVEAQQDDNLDIAAIQALLNLHGYGPLVVDGVMGPRTRAALTEFANTSIGRGELPPAALALVSNDA